MKKSFKTKKINHKEEVEVKGLPHDFNRGIEEFYNSSVPTNARALADRQSFQKPPVTNSRTLVFSLAIAVIFGFLAGVLALFLFLSGAFTNSRLFSWLDINSLLPTAHIIIERQEETTVLEDERIGEVVDAVSSVGVGIFNYKTPSNDRQRDIYQQEKFLGNGLILTNDGWIVTTNDVVKIDGEYAVVTQNHEIYQVKRIERDGSLGLIFLKVEAENLPVISMAQLQNVYLGERVVCLGGLEHFNKDLVVTRVGSRSFSITHKLIQDSENYYLHLSLTEDLNKNFWGAPVFNLNKQVIGLVSNYQNTPYIIPVDYFKKSFNQLLTLKKIERTYLGIEYIDLASAISPDLNQIGALITNIKEDSPLKALDVEAGDTIVKIDDDMINNNKNLTYLIQSYQVGDKIKLIVLKKDNGKEVVVEVVLK